MLYGLTKVGRYYTQTADNVLRYGSPSLYCSDERGGIYKLFSKEGCLLYVGVSDNIPIRVCSHLKGYGGSSRFAHLIGVIKFITYKDIWGLYNIAPLKLEKLLIQELSPLYNIAHKEEIVHDYCDDKTNHC